MGLSIGADTLTPAAIHDEMRWNDTGTHWSYGHAYAVLRTVQQYAAPGDALTLRLLNQITPEPDEFDVALVRALAPALRRAAGLAYFFDDPEVEPIIVLARIFDTAAREGVAVSWG